LLQNLASDSQVLEDRLLIRRFNRGDEGALCRIYEKYKHHLLKVATALLNDRSAVEDVVHDVFVSFAQGTGGFELSGNLKGYLSICIANRARDRNRAVQQNAGLDDAEQIGSDADGPADCAVHRELSQKLNYAMKQLPYEQREAIILHVQSKMRFRQIAKLQGVSVNTIQSRYRYGLNKLRSILTDELKE
jgi:RNA polymerase sigma-70 factor (ECF subfamily)